MITWKKYNKQKKVAEAAEKRLIGMAKDIYDMRGAAKAIKFTEDLAKLRFAEDTAEELLLYWWEEG